MLQRDTIHFLKKLKNNNNKEWMDANRNRYELAKMDFLSAVAQLLEKMTAFDNSLSGLSAKNCIFRINRDIRFSKDKRPYKNNFAAYFSKGGRKGPYAGYYLHIEPGSAFLAVGVWMPEPKELAAIRQEIDYQLEEWLRLLKHPAFKKHFAPDPDTTHMLSRAPKGYEEDNPAIGYLKLKSFIWRKDISDEDMTSKSLRSGILQAFKAASPLIQFINRSLE